MYNKYKHEKTCGIIDTDPMTGIQKVAEPVGVIAGEPAVSRSPLTFSISTVSSSPATVQTSGCLVDCFCCPLPLLCLPLTSALCLLLPATGIVPVTNPTATAIFKSLIALKTRNCIVLCPHPLAQKATQAAARIVRDAAIAAGAPENCVSWVEHPSIQASQALMQAPEISMILATGGPAMVRAAYSSGHPALGVGALGAAQLWGMPWDLARQILINAPNHWPHNNDVHPVLKRSLRVACREHT